MDSPRLDQANLMSKCEHPFVWAEAPRFISVKENDIKDIIYQGGQSEYIVVTVSMAGHLVLSERCLIFARRCYKRIRTRVRQGWHLSFLIFIYAPD